MIDKYEAAELLVVGRAQDVILGEKVFEQIDNVAEPPPNKRDTPLALFEE
jgi:hypothetical protein